MEIKALLSILTWVNLLLVQGLHLNSSMENHGNDTSRRILYGKPAAVSDFPFLVKLDIGGSTGAGAIISKSWILTAGHCVHGVDCSAVNIFPAVWQPGEKVTPVKCYPHPEFNPKSTLAYDLGLIEVGIDLIQDGRAKAVTLPAPGAIFRPGTPFVFAGWGQTETNEPIETKNLLQGNFQVEEWDYCNKIHLAKFCEWSTTWNCVPSNMPSRILCTKGQGHPPAGTCFGDSGGPLVINGVIAGVLSFGVSKGNGCKMGEPTMHVTVADYLPWIYSHIAPEMDTSKIQVRPEENP